MVHGLTIASVERVSALRLRIFAACRLRYRYQYLDSVAGRLRPRLRPSDTAGSLVHRVLADFYTKVPQPERTAGRLLALFDAAWGALSPRYLRMPEADGLRAASIRQLENFAAQFDGSREPYLVEPYLQIELAGVRLFGRPDRLDEESDGTLQVIDYKTGAMPGDVDSGQLTFYAIMVEQKLERPVSRLSYWYLDDGSIWSVAFTDDVRLSAREKLITSIHEMLNVRDFPPTIGPHCAGCHFLHGCEVRTEVAARRAAEGW